MPDITEEINTKIARDKPDIIDPATINPSTLPETENKEEYIRKKTGGERIFNRVVYTGIGFGVNEASALVIADVAQHGAGKKLYAGIRNWMVKAFKFGEKITKEGVRLSPTENAGNALLTFTVLISGTLLVWPMKALEDNKAYWVRKGNHFLDRIRGNKDETAIAARDLQTDEAIACESKQSWPSLLIGRTLAVAVTMVNSMYILGPERMQKAQDFSDKWLTKGVVKANKLTGNRPDSMLARMSNSDTFHRYTKLIGLETICCTVSSITLEIVSKLFAKASPHIKNPELCAEVKTRAEQNDEANDTKAITQSAMQPPAKQSGRTAATIAARTPSARFSDAVSKAPDSAELALR